MKIKFSKYQGAGNDFIIINMIDGGIILSTKQIAFLCDRRFGIGADGLMTISKDDRSDFYMQYYNSDGKEGSMCGNGGRCIAQYAFLNNICGRQTEFNAIDGKHKAIITKESVSLSMNDVSIIEEFEDGYFLNTGSPHFVKFVQNAAIIDIKSEGLKIANQPRFAPDRTNVNFVELSCNKFNIYTFERGVEDETLACGTGTVAAALALHHSGQNTLNNIEIIAKGGILNVSFECISQKYSNIVLNGPAVKVFDGEININ